MKRRNNIREKYTKKIYNDNLFKQIRFILGDSASFNKSNINRKINKQNKIKELMLLNTYALVFNETDDKIIKDLEKEFNLFEQILERCFKAEIKRKDSSELINRLKLSIEYLIELVERSGLIEGIKYENVIERISILKIYSLLVHSAASSVTYFYDNDYIEKCDIHKTEIISYVFYEKLVTAIILYLTTVIISNSTHSSKLLELVYEEMPIIKKNVQTHYIEEFTLQLMDVFIETTCEGVRTVNYHNDMGEIKGLKLIKLPDKIVSEFLKHNHLPEIIPPDTSFENIQHKIMYSKVIVNGVSKVQLGSETKRALSISQRKKFKINPQAIELFETIDELPYEDVKDLNCLPFTPIKHLVYLEERIEALNKCVDTNLLASIKEVYRDLKKSGTHVDDITLYISEKLGISTDKVEKCNELYTLEKDYKKRLKLRATHNTIIEFAKIFQGFPIHFIETFDFRLRMYAYSYMFSRNTGMYKHLLMDYKEVKLTDKGFATMLKCFYHNYSDKYNELDGLINNNNLEELIEWYKNNMNIDLKEMLKNDSFIYHILLKMEIEKIISSKKKKTGFMVEVDQKTSSLVIGSLILGDNELARAANINSTTAMDAAKILMEKSYSWFKGKISDESLVILSTTRDIHKYLLMCALYNETYYGRRRRLESYIKNYEDVNTLAKLYPEFIDSTFQNFSLKKSKLNDIVRFSLKQNNPINITTIDGSLLTWYIFKEGKAKLKKGDHKKLEKKVSSDEQVNLKKKYSSPLSGNPVNYDAKKMLVDKKDKRKMLSGFLPSYIHSIDGAIMRLILLNIYDKEKYIITHLHDSIQFHPNYYDSVINSITEVYCSKKLDNILDKTLLQGLRAQLLPEKLEEFDEFVNSFKDESYHSITVNREDLNVNAMFSPE